MDSPKSIKFLFDECISKNLENIAIDHRYIESTNVNHRGLRGRDDVEIMQYILEHDFTFVTCNSNDFRPSSNKPQKKSPLYVGIELHAGLVCLNLTNEAIDQHQNFFNAALEHINELDNLINKLVEVWPDKCAPGKYKVSITDFPSD